MILISLGSIFDVISVSGPPFMLWIAQQKDGYHCSGTKRQVNNSFRDMLY